MSEQTFRGFNENYSEYHIEDKIWKIKEVKGLKPKELGKTYRKLIEDFEGTNDGIKQADILDRQDDWAKEVLETYFEGFVYDEQIENYELSIFRHVAGDVYGFLSVIGTNLREQQYLSTRSVEIQKLSESTQT